MGKPIEKLAVRSHNRQCDHQPVELLAVLVPPNAVGLGVVAVVAG